MHTWTYIVPHKHNTHNNALWISMYYCTLHDIASHAYVNISHNDSDMNYINKKLTHHLPARYLSYSMWCTLYVYFTKCTPYDVYCTTYSKWRTLYAYFTKWTTYGVQYVTYIVHVLLIVYSIRRTLYDVQYVSYIVRVLHDVYSIRRTL